MRRFLLVSAFALSACTQSPAGVVNRGTEGYTRGVPNGYTQPKGSISGPTHQAVAVTGITSTDLEPLPAPVAVTSSDLAPPPMPAPSAPPAPAAAVSPTASVPVNPNVTEYETNPSHILGAVKVGTTTAPPAAAPSAPSAPVPVSAQAAPAPQSGKFIWPVKGRVIQGYGKTADGAFNDGINISAGQGSPVVAAADGEVVYSGSDLQGYGNMVIIRHANNIMTAYAHADRILVDKGDTVQQGMTIATVGKSGGVSEPQLHFGVRVNKEPVDPTGYLK